MWVFKFSCFQILKDCVLETNCNYIVDIGAGMGHLARVLVFKYGLSVTCVEQDPLLIAQAKYEILLY